VIEDIQLADSTMLPKGRKGTNSHSAVQNGTRDDNARTSEPNPVTSAGIIAGSKTDLTLFSLSDRREKHVAVPVTPQAIPRSFFGHWKLQAQEPAAFRWPVSWYGSSIAM